MAITSVVVWQSVSPQGDGTRAGKRARETQASAPVSGDAAVRTGSGRGSVRRQAGAAGILEFGEPGAPGPADAGDLSAARRRREAADRLGSLAARSAEGIADAGAEAGWERELTGLTETVSQWPAEDRRGFCLDMVREQAGNPAGLVALVSLIRKLHQPLHEDALSRLVSTDAPDSVRGEAAVALGELGTAEAVRLLILQLDPPAAGVFEGRHLVAYALGLSGCPAAVAPLIRVLASDPDRSVRCHAALALGSLGMPEGIAALEQAAAGDDYGYVRRNSIVALRRMDSPEARQALERVGQAGRAAPAGAPEGALIEVNPR